MADTTFDSFRLVGGTSLSLRLGHRMSIDIDLFSNAQYGDLDFHALQSHLRGMFPYCEGDCGPVPGMGATWFVGNSRDDAVKLDLFYTDDFIGEMAVEDGIRLASIEDIIAMKLDVVARGGRKKDFWDLHELSASHSVSQMLDLYEKRYPYNYTREQVLQGFSHFEKADAVPEAMSTADINKMQRITRPHVPPPQGLGHHQARPYKDVSCCEISILFLVCTSTCPSMDK